MQGANVLAMVAPRAVAGHQLRDAAASHVGDNAGWRVGTLIDAVRYAVTVRIPLLRAAAVRIDNGVGSCPRALVKTVGYAVVVRVSLVRAAAHGKQLTGRDL